MASKDPLVSIICAVRNDVRFIRETLESVVSQTYPNLELIIMDGVSTDNTLEIIKEYAAKYKNIIFRSQPDKGQWDALEKALALAKGEYISMLCGQDGYLDKDWFKKCIEVFGGHPEVSLVWGIPLNMSEEGKLLGPGYAFAEFLKDKHYGTQTKTVSTFAAKIDWRRPGAWDRFKRFARKLTPSRAKIVFRSLRKREIPQKEDWFFYWLRTGRAFPEGNMCVRREAYMRNTPRFPQETMTPRAIFDFCFDFNVNGYLAYGLPVAASFGRLHAGSQRILEDDDMFAKDYNVKTADFREKMKAQKTVRFVNPAGEVVSERAL